MSHVIVKIVFRGLLGSGGFYVQAVIPSKGAAMVRTYVSLDDIVWC